MDNKLSVTEELILGMLIKHGEMYGLQMVESSGRVIPRGSIYVFLDRMEDKGLVRSRQEERTAHRSGIRRRLYEPTGLGQRVYREWVARRAAILEGVAPQPA